MAEEKEFFAMIADPEGKDEEALSSLFCRKRYDKNAFFIRETEENSRIGFLKSGYMRAYSLDPQGEEAIIRFFKPADLLSGGFAFLFPSPVNIQAIHPCDIYECSWQDFSGVLKREPAYKTLLNRYLSAGSHRTTALLANFIRLDAAQRYRLFLREYPGLIDEIPHYYIANYLGISSVQLSRIRKKISH